MRTSLRAGVAIYNDGHFHAAHDAWEAHWLDLEAGTADELLLHGLIQFTGAVYHAHNRNWAGTVGLAESAVEYLTDLEDDYRDCNVADVRRYLERLGDDPELIERRPPLALTHEDAAITLADCDPAETAVAAAVLAEEWGFEEEPIERAGEYALADLDADRTDSSFLAMLADFVDGDPRGRALIYQRLCQHVDRRESRDRDVEGLFDE